MMRKIPVLEGIIEYDDSRLELFVDFQDPTKFVFTDKSITPLMIFRCDHDSISDLQRMVNSIMTEVLSEWDKLHRSQDQRNRITDIATGQNVNIITDSTRKFAE